MNARPNVREHLAEEGITAELFRTEPGNKMRLTVETREALRRLARRSARSGRLSPFGYNMTISHKHQFIWFRVAKVGTRTLFSHFATHDVPLDLEHAMRVRYPVAVFEGYYKFAFVRHPLERFLSAWRNKVVDHNYFGFDESTRSRMQRVETFARWTAEHDLSDLADADHHLALQSRLIDLNHVDFVGRLENFDTDFAEVCAHVGLPTAPLQARNRSSHRDTAPQPASDELRSLVRGMYRRDFQIFGY